MLKNRTDRDWERIGKSNPYYGVVTEEKYRSANLTESLKEDFFRSGSDISTIFWKK